MCTSLEQASLLIAQHTETAQVINGSVIQSPIHMREDVSLTTALDMKVVSFISLARNGAICPDDVYRNEINPRNLI